MEGPLQSFGGGVTVADEICGGGEPPQVCGVEVEESRPRGAARMPYPQARRAKASRPTDGELVRPSHPPHRRIPALRSRVPGFLLVGSRGSGMLRPGP